MCGLARPACRTPRERDHLERRARRLQVVEADPGDGQDLPGGGHHRDDPAELAAERGHGGALHRRGDRSCARRSPPSGSRWRARDVLAPDCASTASSSPPGGAAQARVQRQLQPAHADDRVRRHAFGLQGRAGWRPGSGRPCRRPRSRPSRAARRAARLPAPRLRPGPFRHEPAASRGVAASCGGSAARRDAGRGTRASATRRSASPEPLPCMGSVKSLESVPNRRVCTRTGTSTPPATPRGLPVTRRPVVVAVAVVSALR